MSPGVPAPGGNWNRPHRLRRRSWPDRWKGEFAWIAGTLNCIWGIAAIDGSTFFVEDTKFIVEDLNTMGWIVLGIGVLQLIAALSIWAGGEFGRWIGVIGAGLGALGALLSIPGFSLWPVCVFSLNVLVVYGITAYGGRQARAT